MTQGVNRGRGFYRYIRTLDLLLQSVQNLEGVEKKSSSLFRLFVNHRYLKESRRAGSPPGGQV